MFIILLRFAEAKSRSTELLRAHNDWVARGLEEGVFLVVGSLAQGAGGMILAHGTSLSELRARVDDDPFVRERVVHAEIVEATPSKADPRLSFLLP